MTVRNRLIPMRNDNEHAVRLGRGAKLYVAAPGETIDVYRIDVRALTDRGFTVVRDRPAPSPTEGLEDLDREALYVLAQDRNLRGRSSMSRDELVAALTEE